MEMLKEESGKYSSKRIWASVILLVLVTLFVWKEFRDVVITNKDVFFNFMLFASILLGVDVAKYLARPKESIKKID